MIFDDFSQVQQNRTELYRFFARLFKGPLAQDDIEMLAAAQLVTRKSGDAAFDHGMWVMGRYLEKRNTGTREFLGRDYAAALMGIRDENGRYALPYESAFVGVSQNYMGAARGKVYNIYKKQALKLREGIDLPEDHLAFMCEFMALLADQTVAAKRDGNEQELRNSLLLSEAFLKHHILNWYSEFAALATRLVDDRFYKGLFEAAGAFFSLDAKVIHGVLREEKIKHARSFNIAQWELANPSNENAASAYPTVKRNACLRVKGMTCDVCTSVCPEAIDPIANRKKNPQNVCTSCGACVAACPKNALTIDD